MRAQEDSFHLEGEYWGLWGPGVECRYTFAPRGENLFVGSVTLYRRNGSLGATYPIELKKNELDQWCLNWESDTPDEQCADDLRFFDTNHGRCLASHYFLEDPSRGKIWRMAVIWLDTSIPSHPNHLVEPTELRRVENRNVNIKWYSADDGLMSNNVRAIAQQGDKDIWVGSTGGISRFDGRRWENFGAANAPALRDESITDILSTSWGDVYFASKHQGIYCYKGGEFHGFDWNDEFESQAVASLVEGFSGDIWFQNKDTREICRIDPEGQLVRYPMSKWGPLRFGEHPGLPKLINFLQIDETRLLMGTWGGTRIFDSKTQSMSILNVRRADTAVYRLRSGEIWARVDGYFGRLDEADFTFGDNNYYFYGMGPMIQAKNGDIWFTTIDDLYRFRGDRLEYFPEVGEMFDSHLGEAFEDHEGNIWVASAADGVARVRLNTVTSFRAKYEIENCQPQTLSVSDNGKTWMAGGSYFGVVSEDGVTRLTIDEDLKNSGRIAAAPSVGNFLEHECVVGDRGASDAVWIGLGNGAFDEQGPDFWSHPSPVPMLARRDSEEYQYFGHPEYPEGVEHVHAMAITRSGQVWLGTDQGVFYLDDVSRLRNWGKEVGRDVIEPRAIMVDDSDRVWISSMECGVYVVDPDNGFEFLSKETGELASNYVRAMIQDSEGRIWLAGLGGVAVREEGATHIRVGGSEIVESSIFGIVEDQVGSYWFGTNRGLYAVGSEEFFNWMKRGEPSELETWRFGRRDGMANEGAHEEHGPPGVCEADGDIVFCVNEGMVRVDPEEALVSHQPLQVVVDGIFRGAEVLYDGRRGGDATARSIVRLPPEAQEFIEFEFGTFTYTFPEIVEFEYRLLGFSDEWKRVRRERRTLFAGLAPGSYEFQVRVFDHHGALGETERLAFAIQPMLFQRAWARVLAVGLTLGALHRYYRRRMRRRLKALETRRAAELMSERARISRDMHDEIGVGLACIRLLSGQMSRRKSFDEKSAKKLERLAAEASENLREVIWSLKPHSEGVSDLGEFVQDYVSERIEGAGIELEFNLEPEADSETLHPRVKRAFILNLKGALSNTLRHAHATRLKVVIGIRNEMLWMSFSDNGIGFDSDAALEAGTGLRAIQERLAECGGGMSIRSSIGNGTHLETFIPLS